MAKQAPAIFMSAKAVADELGVDAKTFRRFMRKAVTADGGIVGTDTPGSGGRYAIASSDLAIIRKRFDAWNATGGKRVVTLLDPDAMKPARKRAPRQTAVKAAVNESIESADSSADDGTQVE